MPSKSNRRITVLETGDIYFFYRSKPTVDHAQITTDIEQLYLILASSAAGDKKPGKRIYRIFEIAQQQLPAPSHMKPSLIERRWATNVFVASDPNALREIVAPDVPGNPSHEKETHTAWPVGEGKYQIHQYGAQSELAYILELPQNPGPAQQLFRIEEAGRYVLGIRAQQVDPSDGTGYKDRSKTRRKNLPYLPWKPITSVDGLNRKGVQIILTSANADEIAEKVELTINEEEQMPVMANIFRDLKFRQEEVPVQSLFRGKFPLEEKTGSGRSSLQQSYGEEENVPPAHSIPDDIARLLSGIDFPKEKNELIQHAERNKLYVKNARRLIDLLDRLPGITYGSYTDIEHAFARMR